VALDQDVSVLVAATSAPSIHLSTKLILIVIGVVLLGAFGRYLEARDRERRREARKQRQREYRRYLKSDGWRQRRQPALELAQGFCRDCGSRRDLDVHHLTYVRQGAERPEDLVALCRQCHKARHKGDRTALDWMLLAVLRWWRIRRYRREVTAPPPL
jgi:5-methylcytosine-specific restriction endonuclease McrA